jgi:FKBP-type peptidyl-prolyl cis-trans isomerase SlyD
MSHEPDTEPQYVTADTVVTITYRLHDEHDRLLEEIGEEHPLVYLHGHGVMLEALEEELEGLEVGESFDVTLPPERAYGPYHDRLLQRVPREKFPDELDLEIGATMTFQVGEGELAQRLVFRVKRIREETVTLDANRPLAGKTLRFRGEVLDLREPTEAEREAARRGEF